jgi:biotin operon repressor
MRNSEGAVLVVPRSLGNATESQENLVYDTLSQNRYAWLTLDNIRELTGIPSTGSIASRIRDLRTQGVRIEKRLSTILSVGRARVFEYTMTF